MRRAGMETAISEAVLAVGLRLIRKTGHVVLWVSGVLLIRDIVIRGFLYRHGVVLETTAYGTHGHVHRVDLEMEDFYRLVLMPWVASEEPIIFI